MKILDNDFRNQLYKSLVDAGYEKTDAQKIVGVKYYDALNGMVLNTLEKIIESVKDKKFNVKIDGDILNEKFDELKKLDTFLNGEKEEKQQKAAK